LGDHEKALELFLDAGKTAARLGISAMNSDGSIMLAPSMTILAI